MLIEGGFLFVGLRMAAGVGRIRAWHLQTMAQYSLDGHTVGGGIVLILCSCAVVGVYALAIVRSCTWPWQAMMRTGGGISWDGQRVFSPCAMACCGGMGLRGWLAGCGMRC